MTSETISETNPREIRRPFSSLIVLGPTNIVSLDRYIALKKQHQTENQARIFIARPLKEPVFFDYQLENNNFKAISSQRNDKGIQAFKFNGAQRRIAYIGKTYRVEFLAQTRTEVIFRIESTKPIEVRTANSSQDLLDLIK